MAFTILASGIWKEGGRLAVAPTPEEMEKELQWLLLPLLSPSYRPLSSLTLGLTYTLLPQDSGDLACWLEKQANFMLG